MAKEDKDGQKLTYEQLFDAAEKLSAQNKYFKEQNQQLIAKVTELADFQVYKRLEFLFKVVESKEGVFPADFVTSCAQEIVDIMTIPENPENPESKEEK